MTPIEKLRLEIIRRKGLGQETRSLEEEIKKHKRFTLLKSSFQVARPLPELKEENFF